MSTPPYSLAPVIQLSALRAWTQSSAVTQEAPVPKTVWLEAWGACLESLAVDELRAALLQPLDTPQSRRELVSLLLPLGFTVAQAEQVAQRLSSAA